MWRMVMKCSEGKVGKVAARADASRSRLCPRTQNKRHISVS